MHFDGHQRLFVELICRLKNIAKTRIVLKIFGSDS